MVKRYACFWLLLVVSGLGVHVRLDAWAIENIQNDLPYAIRVELDSCDEEETIVLDVAPGTRVPFGYTCPFEPDLKKGFDDFENLSTTLSVAPASSPLCKGFIAEGVYTRLRCPATFYYQEGSPTPRNHILWYSLGFLTLYQHSYDKLATLRLFEKTCTSAKKGIRKRMCCEVIDIKSL